MWKFGKWNIFGLATLMLFGAAFFYPPSKSAIYAQQTTVQSADSMPGMNHGSLQTNFITGQLIKDADAYRLFLGVAATSDDSFAELDRQQGMFGFLNLTSDEFTQVHQILFHFKTLFDSAVADYNQTAVTALANGQTADLKAFLARRDAIVLETVAQLNAVIGTDNASRFNVHIQREKNNMKVALEDSSSDF